MNAHSLFEPSIQLPDYDLEALLQIEAGPMPLASGRVVTRYPTDFQSDTLCRLQLEVRGDN